MKILKQFIFIILLLSLGACVGEQARIGYQFAGKLNKGYAMQKFLDKVNKKAIETKEFDCTINNSKYTCLFYARIIDEEVRTHDHQSIVKTLFPKMQTSLFTNDNSRYDLFVFAFKNDKLEIWGSLDDFKRSDDNIANDLGIQMSNFWLNR